MTVLTMKDAKKTIQLIATAGRKLDERIHTVAVSGVAHCLQHKDTTLISDLVKAMPKSARGNALKFFITKHLPVVWDNKAHKTGGFKLSKEHGIDSMSAFEKIAKVKLADAEPFYMKEDKEANVWNPNAALTAYIKKLSKFAETHSVQLDQELLDTLNNLSSNKGEYITSEDLLKAA